MNKKIPMIILYAVFVIAGIFIIYRRYLAMDDPNVNAVLNYALLVGFILFTYINLRRLINLIQDYKK